MLVNYYQLQFLLINALVTKIKIIRYISSVLSSIMTLEMHWKSDPASGRIIRFHAELLCRN